MIMKLFMMPQSCSPFEVPELIYYSHIPLIFSLILIIIFILDKSNKKSEHNILLVIAFFFALWVILDTVLWMTSLSDIEIFVWATMTLIEPLIYVSCLYLIYLFTLKKDPSFRLKLIWCLLYFPVIIFAPTKYMLSRVDLVNCLAVEGPFINYSYGIEIIFLVWILLFTLQQYILIQDKEFRKKFILLNLGIALSLLFFTIGNIIGSVTDDWDMGQIALLGIPVFIGFLIYLISKYETFDIKLLGEQALILSTSTLIGSLIFIRNLTLTQRGVIFVTFVMSGILGYFFIRNVKKVVLINEELKEINKQKSEFISLATHHIATPLTVVKGYVELIRDGKYGKVPDEMSKTLEVIEKSTDKIGVLVRNFLNVIKKDDNKFD
jgi:hypothetical protein